MTTKPRVLFVDDVPDLLASVRLNLRKVYRVETATSGAEGLECIASSPPFEVVVSDMRMPQMNGAEFLAKVRAVSPEATRILLTGETDLASAIDAVNNGAIFRFLQKPCDTESLTAALAVGVEQHRLIRAERDLLENTLLASVQLLTDILGHVHPQAFSRSRRILEVVRHMLGRLRPDSAWAYEIAGMTAHIGLVTVPPTLVEREYTGEALQDWEQRSFDKHPSVGAEMLCSIPRLEGVARMVERQAKPATEAERTGAPTDWAPEVLGGELLRVAAAFEQAMSESGEVAHALEVLEWATPAYPEALLECLSDCGLDIEDGIIADLQLDQLLPGMITQQNVLSADGALLAAKGTTISPTLLERLRNFDLSGGIQQPIRMLKRLRGSRGKKSA